MRSSRGFTLIEALIALAIVTGGLLSLVGLAQHVTGTVAWSRHHLSAAVLADAYIAQRAASPLAATPADCLQRDRAGCLERLDAAGQVTMAAPVFHRRWQIAPVVGLPGPAWSLSVCVVPVALRQIAVATPGACVNRVVSETAP